MTEKTNFRSRIFSALFAVFFAISSLFLITANSEPAYAVPETSVETEFEEEEPTKDQEETEEDEDHDTCAEQTGSMYWIVCPLTKTIAGAVDSMYSLFDDILEIKPFSSDQNSPIRLVWNYVRNITNIIFIIILLIVVYSQLTGIGINNFGIKRILPRLIIAAILVNLSWIICSLAIDLSNIIGISLRGAFTNIKDTALAAGTVQSQVDVDWASLLGGVVSGGVVAGVTIAAVGGLGALFWMLIPILLGALVAVLAGVITVAARQAVVALLLMISPLAFVAYLIPNTEKWFEKWKKTLIQMLIFFPTFSFLFGASELIGWTIITSATNGFGLILGMAVQVFPLFFAFSLMKMSGTALAAVNNAVRKMSSPVQKGVGIYSDSQRELRRQKYLASKPRNFQLSKRFAQKINDDSVRRSEDTKTYAETALNRGKAKSANYRTRRGTVSRRGEELYEMQARNRDYQNTIDRRNADYNAGLGVVGIASNARQKKRLEALDEANVLAFDRAKYEQERAAKIDYENTVGYWDRTRRATMSHIDPNAIVEGKTITSKDRARYEDMLRVMDGSHQDTLYIDAGASYGFSSQNKIVSSKFSELFNSAAPTQQLVDILKSLTTHENSSKYVDHITSGLRALNMRGDTDLATDRIQEIIDGNGIELGTHASQTLAGFCMFDVKDNDPFLRRFGKYINLETAHTYNHGDNQRHNRNVTIDEYVTGQYQDIDNDGNEVIRRSKRDMVTLLKGTSFAKVERTAFQNLTASIRRAYTDDAGQTNIADFQAKLNETNTSIFPNVIGDVLTYASGSEQITAFSQYLTGLKEKNGSYQQCWEDPDNPLYGLPPEYFMDTTKNYINAQVPNQIANFKSDVFGNVRALLRNKAAEDYENAYHISRDQKVDEYLREAGYTDFAAVRASDNESDKAALKKANERADDFYDTLSTEEHHVSGAKQTFRNALGNNVYSRLERSARSGSLNSTKGPVGDWLGVFDNLNRNRPTTPTSTDDDSDEPTPHDFTDSMRENLIGQCMDLYSDSDTMDEYFEQANDLLEQEGLASYARELSEYYYNNPTATLADVHNYLMDILNRLGS